MSIRHTLLAAAITAALPAATAAAQDTPVGVRPYRFTVEGLLSQSWVDGGLVPGNNKNTLGGYGVRVMFNRSTPAATLRSFAERASVGAFTTYTAGQGALNATTLHFGVQADVALLPTPAYRGTLDPFFSLGLGGFRAKSGGVSTTKLALTPGIGTRIPLITGFGFRGDLRAPIVFGTKTTVNTVAEGGVYLSF